MTKKGIKLLKHQFWYSKDQVANLSDLRVILMVKKEPLLLSYENCCTLNLLTSNSNFRDESMLMKAIHLQTNQYSFTQGLFGENSDF